MCKMELFFNIYLGQMFKIIAGILCMFSGHASIITIDTLQAEVLRRKAENIQESELGIAKEIGEKLYAALEPYFPAAGLAAPQIGISKAVFIFSYDRDPKHL